MLCPLPDPTLEIAASAFWLASELPKHFPGASFELEDMSVDGPMLSLRVESSFPCAEFRERNHQLHEAIRTAGHHKLAEVIAIFQRRCRTIK